MKTLKRFIHMLRVKSELSYEEFKLQMQVKFLNSLLSEENIDKLREEKSKISGKLKLYEQKKMEKEYKETSTRNTQLDKLINTYEDRLSKLEHGNDLLEQNYKYVNILKNNWK